MDTKYLNYILTIAKKQNMTKAAEELFVSQSSLSQYLTKLESQLGTPLFFRSKGRLTLTPAGQLYVEAAKKVLAIKDDLYRNIQSLDNRGHITIGVTSQFGLKMLTEIIPPFKSDFPEVTIEITESNVPVLTRLIQEENIDCAIMALNSPGIFSPDQIHILRQEEVFWSVPRSHPYCQENKGHPVTPKELSQHFSGAPVFLYKKGSSLRPLEDQIIEDAHLTMTTVCETNSITAARSMVAMGIGVTLIAASCASDLEHVAYYPFSPPLTRLNAFVHRKNWAKNPPEENLLQRILSYFP